VLVAESDDLKQFMRDIAARHERIWRDQVRKTDAQLAELRALREASDRRWEENQEEHRAQRQALFQILDRLQNGGAQA
jgi:hypothetical protein